MNKKTIALIAALAVLVLVVILASTSCQKESASTNETFETAQSLETTIPETMGPGVAYNELGEPEFNTTEAQAETKAEEEDDETTEPEETESDETEPEETNPSETEPVETKPEETTAPVTEPETEPQPTAKPMTDYERYLNMSGDEQTAFIESFDSVEAFFAWLNNAKAEHEAANPDIPIGDGSIDLGELAD